VTPHGNVTASVTLQPQGPHSSHIACVSEDRSGSHGSRWAPTVGRGSRRSSALASLRLSRVCSASVALQLCGPCRSRTGFTSCEPLPPPADYCGVGTAERRDRCSCPNPRSIMGPTQPSGFIAALAHLRPSMTGAALSWICASVRSLATLSVQRLQAPRGQSARPGFRASGCDA
jgi:hypothetical protein